VLEKSPNWMIAALLLVHTPTNNARKQIRAISSSFP